MIITLMKAKYYYGSHATGYVLIVNGYPVLHDKLNNLKTTDLYKRWKEQEK